MQHISHTAFRQSMHRYMQDFAGCIAQAEAAEAAGEAKGAKRFAGLTPPSAPPCMSGRFSNALATLALGIRAKFLGKKAGPCGAGMDTRQAGHKRAGTATSLSMSSAQVWHMQCLGDSMITCEADA